MISCCFFERSCLVITFYVGFMLVFLMLLWLCPFFKSVWIILKRNSCGCLGVLGSCGLVVGRFSWDDVGED